MSTFPDDGIRTGGKILIADEAPLVRDALARIASELGDGPTLLEAERVEDAERIVASHPDLVLAVIDARLPGAGTIDAVARLLQAAPTVPILILSGDDDPALARGALDAGARGVISKRSPTRVLVEAMRLLVVGGMYLPPALLRPVAAPAPQGVRPAGEGAAALRSLNLTPRQRDVLALLVQGKPNKAICRELALAEGTVKTHTAAIYRALGVTNRTQAVYAMSRLGAEFAPVERRAVSDRGEPPLARASRQAPRATTRAGSAAESLRTVASRLQANADGGGRWAVMLGLQPA
jgi:DNA-binding NarL/FixJ family response regulator